MGQILDGKALAKTIREELALKAQELKKSKGITPGLAAVLVGDNPASEVYVRNKRKACEEVGFHSEGHRLPKETDTQTLLDLVTKLNSDPNIHGILVQLPLPSQIPSNVVIDAIDTRKDVDGFHPYNLGRLLAGDPLFEPCTPLGVIKMLEHSGIAISGSEVTVVGRSNIVGKPVALMLLHRHATVTICHTRTKNLPQMIGKADILIAAAGKAELVKGSWIKEGAVVIDVGINRTEEGKLIGDVEFEAARTRTSLISPVPGGVGPMTIAMLLNNTLIAAGR